ncbi:MAG: YfhO family protein, partial [Anaerolineae bacterium]|nr:YfhO family protein [Anaerolineae bacterium]
RQGWYAAGLGLVFGLQLLAGHAQTAWYGGVGLGLYALWIVGWQQRDEPYRARARGLVLAGVGAVLGVAVAAIQLVPTAEYLMESQRSGGLDYDTTANLSYSPFRLVTLFSPNFYGTPADGSYITKGIFFEDATYIGFIPIVAALAAVVARMRKRRDLPDHPALRTVPFWALLALAVLVIAMGRYGPVFRLLYDHVPTFDAFREPVRWLILVALALSVLAGIGVGYWGRGKWIVFWSRLAAAGGGAMALMAFGFVEFGQPDSPNLEVLSRGLVVLGAWIVCAALLTLVRPDEATGTSPLLWRSAVLIFIAVDLTWAGTGLNPTVPADFYDSAEITQPAGRIYWFEDYREDVTFGTEKDEDELPAWGEIDGYFNLSDYRIARDNWREVRASLLPNMAMLDEVSALNNNDPLLPGHFGDYVDLIEARGAEAVPLLRAAGVSRVYGRTPPGWDTIVQNDTITYTEAPDGEFPAAWLVSEAVWADSDEQITEALTQPDWDPYTTVVLAGKAPDTLPDEPITGTVELVEDQPTKRRFRVTADGPGFLVISSAFYPGWSAEIDGEDTPLYRANLMFQAVRVPEGQSEVILTYWPRRFWIGALVSGLAILGAVAWIIVDSRRRAPRSTDD